MIALIISTRIAPGLTMSAAWSLMVRLSCSAARPQVLDLRFDQVFATGLITKATMRSAIKRGFGGGAVAADGLLDWNLPSRIFSWSWRGP